MRPRWRDNASQRISGARPEGRVPATQCETCERATPANSGAPLSNATRTKIRATWACDMPHSATIPASRLFNIRTFATAPPIAK